MPTTENSVSGKTSLVARPARSAAASWADPGTAAPIGVNASAPWPPNFSAMVSTPRAAISRIAPCRNSAGPSMMTAWASVPPRCASSAETVTRTTNAATSATRASETWMACRSRRGANASTSTPTQRTADHDQHRRDRAVVDVGGLEGRAGEQSAGQNRHGGHYFVLPSAAEVGAGSVTPTYCSVLDTAGLSMSRAGFG